MTINDLMDVQDGILVDKTYYKDENQREISIDNCTVIYNRDTKLATFVTSSDDDWPVLGVQHFRDILNYILKTYESGAT